jgi:hypothetical protein
MGSKLTAHRVFPDLSTGGNGIAGTASVLAALLKNTPKAVEAAMRFEGGVFPLAHTIV